MKKNWTFARSLASILTTHIQRSRRKRKVQKVNTMQNSRRTRNTKKHRECKGSIKQKSPNSKRSNSNNEIIHRQAQNHNRPERKPSRISQIFNAHFSNLTELKSKNAMIPKSFGTQPYRKCFITVSSGMIDDKTSIPFPVHFFSRQIKEQILNQSLDVRIVISSDAFVKQRQE